MGNKLKIIVQWIDLAVFVWKKNKLCQMRKLTVEMTEHAKKMWKNGLKESKLTIRKVL